MTPPLVKKISPTVDYFRTENDPPLNPIAASAKGKSPLLFADLYNPASTKSILNFGGSFSLGPIFSLPIASAAANPPPPPATWMDFFVQLAGSVESMDLDFFDVPTNRGTGLCRFSEFTPKAERPEKCAVSVLPNTKARTHAEVRPVKGKNESIITRVTVDYTPNLKSLVKTFPDLEIDGFAAVDAPDMSFDKRFVERDKSVKSISGGDYNYENPMNQKTSLRSTFGAAVEAPPKGHNDWMFRFMPIQTNAMAALEETIAEKKGSLMLWAFLPTVGITDEDHFKKFGIRYNTFPRHLEDMVKFLSPMFDPVQGPTLKRNAPFINPNTEYIDAKGERQKIPEDASEVQKLNDQRKKAGLPLLGRNRGSVIDWIFTELANDPARLKDLAISDTPYISVHARLRDTLLKLPLGQIGIDASTDLKVRYYLEKVKDPVSGEIKARLGMRVDLEPLSLKNIDLDLGGFHIHADVLSAKKLSITLPAIPGLVKDGPAGEALPLTIHLEGVQAKGLKVSDASGAFNIEMDAAQLAEVDLSRSARSMKLEVNGLKEENLRLHLPLGDVSVKQAQIPKETDAKDPKKLKVVQSYDDQGKPLLLSVKLPELKSTGGTTLGRPGGAANLQMEGSSTLKDVVFYKQEEKDHSQILGSFDFTGGVDSARVKYGPLGIVQFDTLEKKDGTTQRHELSGRFTASVKLPKDPSAPKVPLEVSFKMKVPYIGFGTEGRLTMSPGASTLRDGTVSFSSAGVAVEGDLDFNASQLKGLGAGPTELGRFLLPEDSPDIQDLKFQGRGKFEFKKDGWSLGKAKDSTAPLKVAFKLKDTALQHQPDLDNTLLGKFPASQVVGTKVLIKEAQVEFEDLRQVEYGQFIIAGEKRGRLSHLDSGPITVHHIQGSGSIWVNLAIWGFVRGLFPSIGTLGSTPTKGSAPARPDSSTLSQHLKTEVQTMLGKGDFFRLGGIYFKRKANGDWTTQLQDFLLNLHEEGGRRQFGMVRIPELNLDLQSSQTDPSRKDYNFDFGKGNFFVNIFLNDPDRGGSFRFVRWPEKPKKK